MAVRIAICVAICTFPVNEAYGEDDRGKKRDRYLLLDSRIIESTDNAELAVGTVQKDMRNPLAMKLNEAISVRDDIRPIKARLGNINSNVIYDSNEKIYKIWYTRFLVEQGVNTTQIQPHIESPEMGVAYATSEDGINWQTPILGRVEFNGSRSNNLVSRHLHGAGVSKDSHAKNPKDRYKMVFSGTPFNPHLWLSLSQDGIRWRQPFVMEGISVHGDTHNNIFWAPTLGESVCITRDKYQNARGEWIRQVARSQSRDLKHWSKAEVVFEGLEDNLQLYSMPVFYHAGFYIGLPSVFNVKTDRLHTELAWSPDTIRWHRVNPGTPLIRNSETREDYDWGGIWAAVNPILLEDEIRLYYTSFDCPHKEIPLEGCTLSLATLRPDGFAGYEQMDPDKPASITTGLVVPTVGELRLSADIQEEGFVRIELLDEHRTQRAESIPIGHTVTDAEVQWREGFALEKINGSKIRLRFEFRKANLYSFSFQ